MSVLQNQLLKWIAMTALAVLLLPGCAMFSSPGNSGTNTQVFDPPPPATTPENHLQIGDHIKVELTGPTGGSREKFSHISEQEVKDDGTISLEFIGAIPAAGRTPREVEKEITDKYVPAYYQYLTVNLTPSERYYYVGGQVNHPGRILYLGATTVSKAIQAAGDFTDYGNHKNVELTRVRGKVFKINCEALGEHPDFDLPVYPGDKIEVKKRIF